MKRGVAYVLAATTERLGHPFALWCGPPIPPAGGHTEPIRPVTLLWPWLLLAAMVVTGAIAAAAFRRRTAHR